MDLGNHSAANMTAAQLQAVMNGMPGGVTLFAGDAELTMLYANEAFYRICGYNRDDFAGKTGMDILEVLVPAEDYDRLLKQIASRENNGDLPEFRVRKKSGEFVWVRLNIFSSPEIFPEAACCIFTDISKEKWNQQELQMQQERYRIITEQLNDVFFEYSFNTDTMTVSSGWEKLFGYHLEGKQVLSCIFTGDYVYDDDKEVITKIFDRANRGIPTSELELRLRRAGGGYIWTSISTTILCEDDGSPIKAIGKISDIDNRKREREKLISNAQREPLTGLYNKVAVESYIRTCLRASDEMMQHALMIIDVDNFKGVNDTLGHLFGDAVLTEISSKLRTLFRSSDILGRFGGDEFIVFLKNVGSVQQIAQKAGAVCDIFRETYTGENRDYKISGSVGVSIYPEHGTSFYELFRQADAALYEAKMRGKDGYVISGQTNLFNSPSTMEVSLNAPEASHSDRHATRSLISDICKLLSDSDDAASELELVLRMVGREFLASRVFIFEAENKTYHKTFEWYAENKRPMLVPSLYGDFSFAMRRFNEDGYYYCPDVSLAEQETEVFQSLKAAGVKTFFQYPIYITDRLVGVIGLEGDLSWPIEERRILTDFCKIIACFLIKYRQDEKIKKELMLLDRVHQNLGIWFYIVKPGEWRIQYLNSALETAVPGAKIGDLCYSALKNRDTVCENCPAARLDGHSQNYYDIRHGRWLCTSAISMDDSENSILVGSVDITHFVNGEMEHT